MSEEIKITEEQVRTILKEKLPIWFAEKLSENYSNPLKDAVEESIKESEGVIKKMVKELLGSIINDDEFKIELKKDILSKIITKGLAL